MAPYAPVFLPHLPWVTENHSSNACLGWWLLHSTPEVTQGTELKTSYRCKFQVFHHEVLPYVEAKYNSLVFNLLLLIRPIMTICQPTSHWFGIFVGEYIHRNKAIQDLGSPWLFSWSRHVADFWCISCQLEIHPSGVFPMCYCWATHSAYVLLALWPHKTYPVKSQPDGLLYFSEKSEQMNLQEQCIYLYNVHVRHIIDKVQWYRIHSQLATTTLQFCKIRTVSGIWGPSKEQ